MFKKNKMLVWVLLLALTLQLAVPVMAEETQVPGTEEGTEPEEDFMVLQEAPEEDSFEIEEAFEVTEDAGGEGNGTEGEEMPIAPAPLIELASATLKYATKTYTGTPRVQTSTTVVTAVVDGKEITLKNGTDYKITYKDNIEVGTASLIVTGKGNYTGKIVKKFKITPVKLSSAKLKYNYKVYTGTPRSMDGTTTVKAMVNGKSTTLKKGTDYTITYKNNTNVGTATMVIKGKGNFTGTLNKTFKIYPQVTTEKVRYWQRNNYKWYLKITASGASTVWTRKSGQDWGLQVDSVGGLGFDSLGTYYYYDNGTLIAVNIMTGSEKWRYSNSTDLAGGAHACFDESGNVYVVSGLAGNPIAMINKSGKLVKRFTWRKNNNYMWPREMSYSNGKLILNAFNSSAVAVKLQINTETGKVTQI